MSEERSPAESVVTHSTPTSGTKREAFSPSEDAKPSAAPVSRTVSASQHRPAQRAVQRRAQRVEEALHEEPYAALRDAFTLRKLCCFLRQRVEKLARKLHGADRNGQEREREQEKCRPSHSQPSTSSTTASSSGSGCGQRTDRAGGLEHGGKRALRGVAAEGRRPRAPSAQWRAPSKAA